jgi:hypothetical protein
MSERSLAAAWSAVTVPGVFVSHETAQRAAATEPFSLSSSPHFRSLCRWAATQRDPIGRYDLAGAWAAIHFAIVIVIAIVGLSVPGTVWFWLTIVLLLAVSVMLPKRRERLLASGDAISRVDTLDDRPPRCPWCDYDLQGVASDRCSECGRPAVVRAMLEELLADHEPPGALRGLPTLAAAGLEARANESIAPPATKLGRETVFCPFDFIVAGVVVVIATAVLVAHDLPPELHLANVLTFAIAAALTMAVRNVAEVLSRPRRARRFVTTLLRDGRPTLCWLCGQKQPTDPCQRCNERQPVLPVAAGCG